MFSFRRKKINANPPSAAVRISFSINYENLMNFSRDKHSASIENLKDNWSSYNHVILTIDFICLRTTNGIFVSTKEGVYNGLSFSNILPGNFTKMNDNASSFTTSVENNLVIFRIGQKALIGFPVNHVMNLLCGNRLVEYDTLLDDYWGIPRNTELIVDSVDRVEKLPLVENLARERFIYENSIARVAGYSLRCSDFESFQFKDN